MTRLSKLREQIRQLRYPPEFRIPESVQRPPPPREAVADAVPAEPVAPPTDLPDGVVADLATSLWRTKKKVAGPATRHVRAAWETLAEAGVEVHDHDGLPFDPGLALDVVAYETRPGVVAEIVLETVRPSVYRSGRCIQLGQVIVAQPEEGLGNGARNH